MMDRNTKIFVTVTVLIPIIALFAMWYTWRNESGTIIGMYWERTIEVQERYEDSHLKVNSDGSTHYETETHYRTVAERTLKNTWPIVPQWPDMRTLRYGERYCHYEHYIIRINSDIDKVYDYYPNSNVYTMYSPKMRVWFSAYYQTSVWSIEPLVAEK
jgi:hypothetical protein